MNYIIPSHGYNYAHWSDSLLVLMYTWCVILVQVCELDIIFNFEKAYFILDEFLMGGEVMETSKAAVVGCMEESDTLQEVLQLFLIVTEKYKDLRLWMNSTGWKKVYCPTMRLSNRALKLRLFIAYLTWIDLVTTFWPLFLAYNLLK